MGVQKDAEHESGYFEEEEEEDEDVKIQNKICPTQKGFIDKETGKKNVYIDSVD